MQRVNFAMGAAKLAVIHRIKGNTRERLSRAESRAQQLRILVVPRIYTRPMIYWTGFFIKGVLISVKTQIEQLKEQFQRDMAAVKSAEALEEMRIAYLGKKGSVTELLKGLKSLSGDTKKEMGKYINQLKSEVAEQIGQRAKQLEAELEQARLKADKRYDISLPCQEKRGSLHPITIVQRELEEIFSSMGFAVEDFSEVTTEFNNFEGVNIPKHHPARDMQDTYYLDNGEVLKTHTSAAQNTILRKYGAPCKAIFPGRCFRNEALDASHETTFFQMEGMMVDKNISISNLIYFMETMLSEVFKKNITVRLRPGFFPFVEPGFELDIQCPFCGGKGCPTCKHGGWIELCPCGMIHPNVLRLGGVDPEEYTGFAFGLGLTRLAMMKFDIHDIRVLNSGNLKALDQFTAL